MPGLPGPKILSLMPIFTPLPRRLAHSTVRVVAGIVCAVLGLYTLAVQAQGIVPAPPEIAARAHLLIDAHSGAVLAESNADEPQCLVAKPGVQRLVVDVDRTAPAGEHR